MWHCQLILVFYIAIKLKEIGVWCKARRKRNIYFTAKLTGRREGGVGRWGVSPSVLTVGKCENFDLFFIEV